MNTPKQFTLFLLLALTIVAVCSALPPRIFEGKGLVTGQPGMNTFVTASPGETTVLERPYDGAPSLIPHSISDFEISRSANDCLVCHLDGEELDEGHIATKVPPSHYIDEYSGDQKDDGVTGMRYNCLQCHVAQSEEEPPVL